MSDVWWELRLSLEMRREHLCLHAIALRRGSVLVVLLFIVTTAVEISRTFVLIRAAVIGVPCDQVAHVA